jgi:uncharacterized protein (DUF488 family)
MNDSIHIFTIGFTRKSAQDFFFKLQHAGVKRVVDVRLNNVSQLAGFTRKDDLQYFLKKLADIAYVHLPELAPTQEILDAFRKQNEDWSVYESSFLELMAARRIEQTVPRETVHLGCLLCSEQTPEHCHRRLVAEYLRRHWGTVQITHII